MIPLRDVIPSRTVPFITITIIAINALAWFVELAQGPRELNQFLYVYGLVPGNFHLATLVTSMFLHGSWSHIIGNMLYLWIFGNNIEDVLGHVRYVCFYVLCGAAAALTQSIINTHSEVPMIGASGAIAGVLGAYLVLFPRAHVLVLVPLGFFTQLMRLPAMLVLGFWFVLQFIQGGLMTPGDEGGVAYWAHIGGFAAGIALIFLLRGRPPAPTPWQRRGPWS